MSMLYNEDCLFYMRPFIILTYLCVNERSVLHSMLDLIGQHMSSEHKHTANDTCSQWISQWKLYGRWITAYLISINTYIQIDFSSVRMYSISLSLVSSRLHTNMNYVNCENEQTKLYMNIDDHQCGPRCYLSSFQSDADFNSNVRNT